MESESTYKVQQSRVYGKGYSYNLNNKIDAVTLCEQLNHYHKTLQLHQNLTQQYDNITKNIIQLQMSVKIVEHEINNLQEAINEINNR